MFGVGDRVRYCNSGTIDFVGGTITKIHPDMRISLDWDNGACLNCKYKEEELILLKKAIQDWD